MQTKEPITKVNFSYPWGIIRRNGNRLLCADNVVRAAELVPCADTFFSVPATIRIRGQRVQGYATCDDRNGERVWLFRAMDFEKEKHPYLA